MPLFPKRKTRGLTEKVGAEVTSAVNSITNTTIEQIGNTPGVINLDKVVNGTTYKKVLSTAISAGLIKLDETVAGTYGKVLSTSISAGLIKLDEVADGTTYQKLLSTQISAGVINLTSSAAYAAGYDPSNKRRVFTATPTTPYDVGDLWLDSSVIKRCTTARASGAYTAADWAAQTLDSVAEGTTYSRVLTTSISAGKILLSQADGTLDNIANGASYGRILLTDISAGHILLSSVTQSASYRTANDTEKGVWNGKPDDMDELGEGVTYKRVLATQISAGKIYLSSENSFATGYNPVLKVNVFRQTSIPTSLATGDLWFDTDDGNKLYVAASVGADQIIAGEWVVAPPDLANATKTGVWYSASGVDIDASTGINIYGTNNALTTRATQAGTIQCYVGADGKIYAGAGAVWLASDGLTIKGSYLNLQNSAGTLVGIIAGVTDTLTLSAQGNTDNIYLAPGNSGLVSIKRLQTTVSNVTASRAKDTVYQNTGTRPLLVVVTVYHDTNSTAIAYIGSTNPPATAVTKSGSSAALNSSDTFFVPLNYYYEVETSAGTISIVYWIETQIG